MDAHPREALGQSDLRLQTDLRAFAIYWKSIVTGRLIEASDSKTINTKDMDSKSKATQNCRAGCRKKNLNTERETKDRNQWTPVSPSRLFINTSSQTTVLAHFQAKLSLVI